MPLLVEFVASSGVQPSQALEIGAGTGTNAIWMAERGFDVLGVDVSPLAVERARAKLEGRALRCRFAALDFLAAGLPAGPFQFVFDRGCFPARDAGADLHAPRLSLGRTRCLHWRIGRWQQWRLEGDY